MIINNKIMKVFVQIVDKDTGIWQAGAIDEPVMNKFEVKNALAHFVNVSDVDWKNENYGEIKGTSKVVSVICL